MLVVADGAAVGFVRPGSLKKLQALLEHEDISSTTLSLRGGRYKVLTLSEDGTPRLEHDTTSLYGVVEIDSKPKKEADADQVRSYIDTSYGLEERSVDLRRKGFVPLLLSAILSVFYLAFFAPYWYFVLEQGRDSVLPSPSPLITPQVIWIHLGVLTGALLLTLIAMATRHRFGIFLALLAYAGSVAYPVYLTRDPLYLLPCALQLFFCLIAFLRRHR